MSGLFTVSQTGVVQSSTGRDIVLFGVGAAVVGGVSLFGGRGRLVQAAVGALLISMITNGLGLLGYSAGFTFLVTGGVLIIAATIDALSRRRSGSSVAGQVTLEPTDSAPRPCCGRAIHPHGRSRVWAPARSRRIRVQP